MARIEYWNPSRFGSRYIEYWDTNGHRFWDYYNEAGRWIKRVIQTEDCTEIWLWLDSHNCWHRHLRWWDSGFVVREEFADVDHAPRSPAHPIFANQSNLQ